MMESKPCLLIGNAAPSPRRLAAWLGPDAYRRWQWVRQSIERNYPGVFSPEWIDGGKKHDWALRYKKSRSFCTLNPEKNRFTIQIVFGADERVKVAAMEGDLATHAKQDYERATTYHDGKWLFLVVDSDEVIADVERLLAAKRKPRPR